MGVIIGILLIKPKNGQNDSIAKVENNQNMIENNVENQNNNFNNTVKAANVSEEKISPKAFVTYKIKYEKCGHETSQYREIPEELVNLTQEELKEKYSILQLNYLQKRDMIMQVQKK